MSETQAVFSAFSLYSKKFEKCDPTLLVEFFHQPAVLMTSEQVAFMHNPDEINAVFSKLFEQLKQSEFHHSNLDSAQITLLSQNQAVVSGVASRYREDKSLIEKFGLTYTLRKDQGSWKIISGMIHEVNELMLNAPLPLAK